MQVPSYNHGEALQIEEMQEDETRKRLTEENEQAVEDSKVSKGDDNNFPSIPSMKRKIIKC